MKVPGVAMKLSWVLKEFQGMPLNLADLSSYEKWALAFLRIFRSFLQELDG